jgi:hypothetical protein
LKVRSEVDPSDLGPDIAHDVFGQIDAFETTCLGMPCIVQKVIGVDAEERRAVADTELHGGASLGRRRP